MRQVKALTNVEKQFNISKVRPEIRIPLSKNIDINNIKKFYSVLVYKINNDDTIDIVLVKDNRQMKKYLNQNYQTYRLRIDKFNNILMYNKNLFSNYSKYEIKTLSNNSYKIILNKDEQNNKQDNKQKILDFTKVLNNNKKEIKRKKKKEIYKVIDKRTVRLYLNDDKKFEQFENNIFMLYRLIRPNKLEIIFVNENNVNELKDLSLSNYEITNVKIYTDKKGFKLISITDYQKFKSFRYFRIIEMQNDKVIVEFCKINKRRNKNERKTS